MQRSSPAKEIREALNQSARAVGERFCRKLRFENRRNTLCISRFSNRKVAAKDPPGAAADLFRASLVFLDFIPISLHLQPYFFILHRVAGRAARKRIAVLREAENFFEKIFRRVSKNAAKFLLYK